MAIDYVISGIPHSGASVEEGDVAHSATITRFKVQGWKMIMKQKVVHAQQKEYVRENLQSPVEIHTFLNSDVVRTKMEELVEPGQEDESTLKRYSIKNV